MDDTSYPLEDYSKSGLTECTFKSEYSNEFKNIPHSSYMDRYEVPVACSRFVYPKECYERGNQLLPKYTRRTSTYRDDYRPWEHPEYRQAPKVTQSMAHHQFVDIDVNHNGYEKYLDIYATVKTLDHRPFSPKEIKHDAITTWDWLQVPKTRGRTIPFDVPIPKRHLENFSKINQPKRSAFVPNRGLLSEYQQEFI